jgi:hypothetical protein
MAPGEPARGEEENLIEAPWDKSNVSGSTRLLRILQPSCVRDRLEARAKAGREIELALMIVIS